jgi:serine/threonine-protein kinase RsbW
MERFHKKYQNAPKAATDIRRDTEAFARSCGFSDGEILDISLAVGEASTNAIEHGHIPESAIEVECWFEFNELWISIEDSGGGLSMSEKTWTRALQKQGEGGYGMLIIKTIMDDVRLAPVPGDGARLVMRKRRRYDRQIGPN